MYSIIVVLNTGKADILNMVDVKDDEFPHVKYIEALKSAEELFDRHVIISYVVTLYKYKGEIGDAERIILQHSQKANVH